MDKIIKNIGMRLSILSPLSMIGVFIAVLLAIAAGSGLFFSGIYDPYVKGQMFPMLLGQDTVSLLSIPILLNAIFLTRRKAVFGPVLWSGILLYVTYAYALLAFGAVYTCWFLLYIALMGLSVYSTIFLASTIDLEIYREKLAASGSVKAKGIYLISLGTVVGIVWILILLRTMIASQPIVGINTVYVLDLTILLPACILVGIQQLRHMAWSYFLAEVLLVKAVTLGLAIILGNLFAIASGWPVNIGLFGMFALFTVMAGGFLFMDIRTLRK
jgi:hypothetical protein